MKLLSIAVLTVMLLMSNTVLAQDSVVVVEDKTPTKIGFGGFRWDDGAIGSYGTGIKIPATDVWLFTYADFGKDGQSGNVEAAYLVNIRDVYNDIPFLSKVPVLSQIMNHTIFDKIIAGPILGPDFDIVDTGSEEESGHTSYLRGAIGFMGVYQLFDKSGISGYVKKKLSLDNESMAGNNWVAGGALYIAF